MAKAIGVRFPNAGKLYFFDPGELWPTPGDYVVVDSTRGLEVGEAVTDVQAVEDGTLQEPLNPVVRLATKEDLRQNEENKELEREAFKVCQRKIEEHRLDMKLVSVQYLLDHSRILFYFTANGRVDFRSLVKDLASVFRTRIELRQIGVRDEAKMIGGLGPCGRPICCGQFLGDFQPVSIKMAKEQNLSLNPTKISGICGRLMCCLKYEEDYYEETHKRMPRSGRTVITPDGEGTVYDTNVIRETVRVRIMKGDTSELKDYPLEQISRPGAPRRTEEGEDRPAEPWQAVPAAPAKTEAAPTEQQPAEEPAQKAQPVMRQARRGKQKGEHPERRPEPAAAQAVAEAPAAEKAEQAPAAPVQPAPVQPAVKPGNAWQKALEDALKSAEGK